MRNSNNTEKLGMELKNKQIIQDQNQVNNRTSKVKK